MEPPPWLTVRVACVALHDATTNPLMITQQGRGKAALLVVGMLAVIAFVTLRPAEQLVVLPAFCVFCGPLGGVDFLLNTALFIPLGLGLRLLTGRWSTAVVIGALTTLVIESLQWRFIPGRDASLGDLIANTLGTMIGAWLAMAVPRVLNGSSDLARRLNPVFAIFTSVLIVISAVLLKPMNPVGAQYVQWTPPRPDMDVFPGRLVLVQVNSRLVRPDEPLPSQWTYDSLTMAMSVRAVVRKPVPRSNRQAIIVRIANEVFEGFMLAQRGDAVVFRSTIGAVRLRLRPLLVGLDGAFKAPSANDSEKASPVLMLLASSNPRAMSLSVEQNGSTQRVTLKRSVGLGWALVLPWDIALTPRWWPVNAIWLGALVFPVAFLTMRSGHRDRVVPNPRYSFALTGLLAVLVVAPALMGLSALNAGEWLGVVTGLAAGVLVERWTSSPMSHVVGAVHSQP